MRQAVLLLILLGCVLLTPLASREGLQSAIIGRAPVYVSHTPASTVSLNAMALPQILFQRTWGGSMEERALGIANDSTGDIYVTGLSYSFGPGSPSVVLLKYDSVGSLLWQRTWGGSGYNTGNAVSVDKSGSVYVTGETTSFGAGNGDVFLLKFNSTGSLLWARTWGGSNFDESFDNAIDSYGNVYLAALTFSFNPYGSAVLLKFNSSGSLVWQRLWPGEGYTEGLGIGIDHSNSVYLTGQMHPPNKVGADLFLLKYDSAGTLDWQRHWGGVYSEYGVGVAPDVMDNIYVSGDTYSFGAGGGDIALLKFNSSGSLLSQITVGGRFFDKTDSKPILDSSGDPIVAGWAFDPPYIICPSSGSIGSLNIAASVTGANALVQNQTTGTPSGTLGSPSGSQTYAGGGDISLFEISSTNSPTTGTTFSCAPAGLSTSTLANGISLAWMPPTYNGGTPVTGYRVYRGIYSANGTLLANLGNQTTYLDTTVSAGMPYTYYVTAVNAQGESGFSNPAYAVLPPTVPSPPTNLTASDGGSQITLRWQAPLNSGGYPIIGYRIYRGLSSSAEAYLTSIPAVQSYVDTNVVRGVRYFYYVTALNSIGESNASNEAMATPAVSVFPNFFGIPISGALVLGITYLGRSILTERRTRKARFRSVSRRP